MYCFVLFLVVNMSFFAESNIYTNDNYNILLNLTKQTYQSRFFEIERVFVVLINKRFVIKLLNYQAAKFACGFSTHLEIVNEEGILNSIVEVASATEEMTGKWKCLIKRNDRTTDLDITFKVRVKGGSQKVNMELGGFKRNGKLSTSPEDHYDEVFRYSYWHGETVDLVCSNEQHYGKIYLRYYDLKESGLKPIIRTGELLKGDNITFQKNMYTKHNYNMIDCTYVTEEDQLEFSYRVIFVLRPTPSNGDMKIVINDVQLAPEDAITNTGISLYHFIFFPDETLTITCELYKDGIWDLNFYNKGFPNEPLKDVVKFEEIGKKTAIYSPKYYVEVPVICTAIQDEQIKLAAYIYLRKRERPKLQVLGLNPKDVITQYTDTSKDWVIDYSFNAGQVLNITCVARNTGALRFFESSKIENNTIAEAQSISKLFALGDAHNKSTIICQDGDHGKEYKRKVIIKLHRKPVKPSDVPGELIACGIVVLTILISVVAALCKVYICRSLGQQSSENSLSESYIPPYPAQWDFIPEYNMNTEECMLHGITDNHSGSHQNESVVNNTKIECTDTRAVQNEDLSVLSPNFSSILNQMSECPESNDKQIYDYVYAQRK